MLLMLVIYKMPDSYTLENNTFQSFIDNVLLSLIMGESCISYFSIFAALDWTPIGKQGLYLQCYPLVFYLLQ